MLNERLSADISECEANFYIPKNNRYIPKACVCIITCIVLPILIYIFIIEIKAAWIHIFSQL